MLAVARLQPASVSDQNSDGPLFDVHHGRTVVALDLALAPACTSASALLKLLSLIPLS